MSTMPTAPQMLPVPQPYVAQDYGSNYNPWDPTSQDSSSGSQNPYASQIQGQESQYTNQASQYSAQLPQMQQQMAQGQQGVNNFQSNSSSYPSYPNSAGAGSQTAGQAIPQVAAPSMQGSGDAGVGTDMTAADTSHGFNPWSLQGEAMTRN